MSRWLRVVGMVLVAGAAAACTAPAAVPRPAGSLAPAATPSPSPVVVPVTAALLAPAEMGTGYSVEGDQPAVAEPSGLPTLTCPRWQPGSPSSATAFLTGVTRTFDAPRGHFDGLTVRRFAGGGAALAIRELRVQLALCGRDEFREHDTQVVHTFTVLASGFAGPGSLLISERIVRDGALFNLDHHVVVRRDDLVAHLWLSDQRWTADQMRPLAVRLATKLCAATAC